MAHKIGVIGDRESVLPFRLFGFEVAYADDIKETKEAFTQMCQAGFGVIYLTETCALLIPEEIEQRKQQMTPAIILIPDHDGARGIGRQSIQENVEKAVGQNIL